MNNFDYEGAKAAGYSDQEIKDYLGSQPKTNKPNYEKLESEKKGFGWFGDVVGKNFKNFTNNFWNPVETQEEPSHIGQEINQKLLKKVPDFDVQGALEAGYEPTEINDYLEENQPKRSKLEKGARIGTQYGLGLLEGSPAGMAYDIATSPLGSEAAAGQAYRETVLDDLERLREQKEMGIWDDQDQQLYDHLTDQIENPENAQQYVQTADIGIRSLAEKATGLDLHPEGFLEKAAQWKGFIQNKGNLRDIAKIGLKPKELAKALFPNLGETTRAVTTGAALELAEQNQLGPIGTLAAAIVGDVGGMGIGALGKIITRPRESVAKLINLKTKSHRKKEMIQGLVNDFDKAGMQIDAGTLTQSPLIRMMQARLSQSGLSGAALENAGKELSQQVVREYENLMSNLGEISFENGYQASEAIKDALRVEEVNLNIPKTQPEAGRGLKGRVAVEEVPAYQKDLLNEISPSEFKSDAQAGQSLKTAAEDIKTPIKEDFNKRYSEIDKVINDSQVPIIVEPMPRVELIEELKNFVKDHSGSLLLGESTAEARVLKSAEKLLKDVSREGPILLKDLIKTKQTLQDIANWEFGGSDFLSSYKKLVGDLNNTIENTLERFDPNLMNQYRELNAGYSAYKDAFENKNLKSLFEPKNLNYNALHNEFTTNPDKLRSLEDVFYASPRGEELIDQLKRDYAQKVTDKTNLTPRDISNLANVLGSKYERALERYAAQREHALQHPLPRVASPNPFGINIRQGTPKGAGLKQYKPREISQTATERAREGLRKKFYESIRKKEPEQIMKKMDTVKGVKELKKVLELTPEGKELFKKLSRYKIAEMIDSKMLDNINGNIKLGKFSKLLSTPEEKSIMRELIGKEAYEKLDLIQRNSAALVESSEKFYNASKSGSTLIDAGLVGTAITGILTGNPFISMGALTKIGGSQLIAHLLSNKKFLKELEKAILTNDPKKFKIRLNNIKPYIRIAHEQLTKDQDKQEQE